MSLVSMFIEFSLFCNKVTWHDDHFYIYFFYIFLFQVLFPLNFALLDFSALEELLLLLGVLLARSVIEMDLKPIITALLDHFVMTSLRLRKVVPPVTFALQVVLEAFCAHWTLLFFIYI